jgi:hypothetical protein
VGGGVGGDVGVGWWVGVGWVWVDGGGVDGVGWMWAVGGCGMWAFD